MYFEYVMHCMLLYVTDSKRYKIYENNIFIFLSNNTVRQNNTGFKINKWHIKMYLIHCI